MNSVHEPSSNGNSKISPSRKPVRKTKPDAQAPSRPSRHAQVRTGAPRRAHGCRIVPESPAVSWQGAGRVAGPSGHIVVSLPHAPRASSLALPPAPQRQRLLAPHALSLSLPRAGCGPSAVSWLPQRPCRGRVCAQAWPYRGLPRDTVQPSLFSQYNSIVLQYKLS